MESITATDPQRVDFERLLSGFSKAFRRYEAVKTENFGNGLSAFTRLLDGYSAAQEKRAFQQRISAEDFNILEVLDILDDESRHSRILAWLLDRRIDHFGTHAQASLGFRLFLEEFGLPVSFAEQPYWVKREENGAESRVDIEVACHRKFVIHIEIKFWSSEGTQQTHREYNDLLRKAAALKVDAERNMHAFFVSLDGKRPVNPRFTPTAWSRIGRVLHRFALEAKAPDVKVFAAHYAAILESHSAVTPNLLDDRNGK